MIKKYDNDNIQNIIDALNPNFIYTLVPLCQLVDSVSGEIQRSNEAKCQIIAFNIPNNISVINTSSWFTQCCTSTNLDARIDIESFKKIHSMYAALFSYDFPTLNQLLQSQEQSYGITINLKLSYLNQRIQFFKVLQINSSTLHTKHNSPLQFNHIHVYPKRLTNHTIRPTKNS